MPLIPQSTPAETHPLHNPFEDDAANIDISMEDSTSTVPAIHEGICKICMSDNPANLLYVRRRLLRTDYAYDAQAVFSVGCSRLRASDESLLLSWSCLSTLRQS